MKKLFKLKKWLTVPEAARHLSAVFDEEVTQEDILRLGLDEQLQLSVFLPSGALAKAGEIRSGSTCVASGESQWIGSGIYDFHMWSDGTRSAIEQEYFGLIGSPIVDPDIPFDGIIVERNNEVFELSQGGSQAALSLPAGSLIVVRPSSLARIADTSIEKSLTTTERNTLLTIIAAICDYSDIRLKERGTAGQIAKLTEDIGASVTDDTVRKVLAQIQNALESRKK